MVLQGHSPSLGLLASRTSVKPLVLGCWETAALLRSAYARGEQAPRKRPEKFRASILTRTRSRWPAVCAHAGQTVRVADPTNLLVTPTCVPPAYAGRLLNVA